MKAQCLTCFGMVTMVAIFATPASSAAQQAAAPAKSTPKGAHASAPAPRTPWGDPDLQGVWTSEPELNVPFERPVEFGNRQHLTDQEFAARKLQANKQIESDNAEFDVETADTSNAGQTGSATSPPPHWLERGAPSRRTSMIIDPPDGRIPPLTPEAKNRPQRTVRGSFGNGPFNTFDDFTLYDRCITRSVPNAIFPAIYNANTQIVQGPGYVAVTYEMIHETRVIPTDGRAHLPSSVRQYLGDARARWEGDTLVIDTTNFTNKTNYRGSGDTLHLIERFTRVNADTLRYELTVDDPHTWTKPWTAALNMKPQPHGMFEYACHEGNHAMRNMLSGSRAAEKKTRATEKK